jgi:hypothetical protein
MINLSMKPKEKDRNFSNIGNSSYIGIFVIYLVSAAVAATVILPGEEYWYFGVIKSMVWPFYSIAKMLS